MKYLDKRAMRILQVLVHEYKHGGFDLEIEK